MTSSNLSIKSHIILDFCIFTRESSIYIVIEILLEIQHIVFSIKERILWN